MKITWKDCFKVVISILIIYLCVFYWENVANLLGVLLSASLPIIFGPYQNLKTGFNKNRYEQFDEIKKYTWTEANICRIIGTIDYTGIYIANKGQTRSFKNKKRVKIL